MRKLIARMPVPRGLNGGFTVEMPMDVELTVVGGPYRTAHLETAFNPSFRVKCATEIRAPFDIEVPCEDFGVPSEADMKAAVGRAIAEAFAGKTIVAGCMGGIGRTGTFIAVLLKVLYPELSGPQLVELTRSKYLKHAIETEKQERLIAEIDVSALQRKVKWQWAWAALRRMFRG